MWLSFFGFNTFTHLRVKHAKPKAKSHLIHAISYIFDMKIASFMSDNKPIFTYGRYAKTAKFAIAQDENKI